MELPLPEDKISELDSQLRLFQIKKTITKRELLSLIGKLSFASKIVPPDRTFLCRLIDLSTFVNMLSHHVTLNNNVKEDIKWWLDFLPLWNKRQKILDPNVTFSPDILLYTDASTISSFGIYFNGLWITQPWPQALRDRSIQFKDFSPYI